MKTIATEEARQLGPRWSTNLIDLATASHSRAIALLTALALLAFVPGFFQLSPIDRDETRFAQATKQMVESGDYVDIRFQNEVRYKKPVGIYWLQSAFVSAASAIAGPDARRKIWVYRVPSLIGAIGAVLLTYWTALAFVPRLAAVLAGAMLATSVLLGVEARLAKTDAMLLLTTMAAMGAMARVYLDPGGVSADARQRRLLPFIFWTAVAGGVLLKGPLILMFIGLAAVTLAVIDREAKWLLALRPLPGAVWVALLVMPWFVAIVARSGGAFFAGSVGEDMLSKVASGQEAHGAPPGYYLLLFFVTFWPASVLAGLALPAVWRDRRQAAIKFLLAWIIPAWVVFELVMTKLPHYVLPLYPAIAILIAGKLAPPDLSQRAWLRRGSFWWFAIPLVLGFGSIAALLAILGDPQFLVWPFVIAAVTAGFLAWRRYDIEGPERSFLRAVAAAVLLAVALYGVMFPSLDKLFPSPKLAEAVRLSGCANPSVALAGYHEPSAVFLIGTATQLTDGAGAAEFLHRPVCGVALIEARQEAAFLRRAGEIGLRYSRGASVDGFNISSGRTVSIAVFRTGERS